MKKTVVINVVGLTPNLLGKQTPQLSQWAAQGKRASIVSVLPAVTCSAQATYLTGKMPQEHGIVGNGWYFRDEGEVKFWRQSNRLVQAPKIWEVARKVDPSFTCANCFWWYNMFSTADIEVTPRPMYPADGLKLPDINTTPADLRFQMQEDLGPFPLFKFWGPATSIASSQWIADSAKWVEERHSPTLTLVYLPHLDYCLQKTSTNPDDIATDLQEIDAVCGDLISFFEARGARVLLLSEYGISPVSQPIHLNGVLREHGLIAIREELGLELLNAGASRAFAVADHQVAHVYINDPTCTDKVRSLLESTPGVEQVLDTAGKQRYQIDHPRAGDFVAVAAPNAWFTYYYWLDDRRAPDFARTVDIHRKPGYDPVELFLDPAQPLVKAKAAWTLLKKKLGFRYLMDVIPLDATLVRGSHGRISVEPHEGPLLLARDLELGDESVIAPTDVFELILNSLQDRPLTVPA
ncbi:MAG: nucleotide pyrophosphatase/phosphodiesterase family protein [Cyanobacteria bacterium J06641_5]